MALHGTIVRFCQQCGRFQSIDEFDGVKRTCRAKLKIHNALRRKARAAKALAARQASPIDSFLVTTSEDDEFSPKSAATSTLSDHHAVNLHRNASIESPPAKYVSDNAGIQAGPHHHHHHHPPPRPPPRHQAQPYPHFRDLPATSPHTPPPPLPLVCKTTPYRHLRR